MDEKMKQWIYDHRQQIILMLMNGALCYFCGYAAGATSIKSILSGLKDMKVIVDITDLADPAFIDALSKYMK